MFAKYVKHLINIPALFSVGIGVLALNADAAFIDFDDIVAPPAQPFACETLEPCGLILSNEYESQGVIFTSDSSWLIGVTTADGTNTNRVFGTNLIGLSFIGALPNFVSFNIDSPLMHEASYFEVYGEDGDLLFTQQNNGWRGLEEISTPYIPHELITINSTAAIKYISIGSLYFLRSGPTIDNLTFEQRSVPESPMLFLLLTGLAGLIFQRIFYKNPLHLRESKSNQMYCDSSSG